MQIAILAMSSLSLAASLTTMVIMYKTKKGLESFGKNLQGEIDNVKTTSNTALRNFKHALDGVEL